MKRLIINGDDFGMNAHCTKAIAQAFCEGLITDTTMMANGDCFDEAVALARQQGFIHNIGIHFNLTEGEPLTEDIRKLTDFVIDGAFHKQFLQNPHALSERETEAVDRELCAQVERIKNAEISITHADSHHYIHNDPYLAPIVARVCRRYGIEKIRLQRNLFHEKEQENNLFWRKNGFITTAFFGRMSDIEQAEIPDSTEIMVHPDFDKNGVLIDRAGVEDSAPVGKKLVKLSERHGIVLTNYKKLI